MNQLLAANDRLLHFVSAHRAATYVAIAVACVLMIALVRLVSARRNRSVTLKFDLGAPITTQFNAQTSAPINTSIAPAPVTPINQARALRCSHCGVTMGGRDNFCPSCGYAQPMKQTGTSVRN